MKQGRKTTFEERIEIVNFTLAHEKDYQGLLRSMVFPTNRSILGSESSRRMVLTVS